MTLELNPVGVKCNLKCTYCYENPMRDLLPTKGYNVDKMLSMVDGNFTLFGGEPLLLPFDDMVRILEYGFTKYKRNGIQTNGTLVTAKHIELFKRTNTHVGISVDGPGELNDARKLEASVEGTRKATDKTIEAIRRLTTAGVGTSLIITIHKLNGIGEKRNRLKLFILDCYSLGVRGFRLHPLENDNSNDLVLSDAENIEAFLDLQTLDIEFDMFSDIKKLLTEESPNVTCTWNGCDPYTTPAVQGIDGDGSRSNCGRTNKSGVSYRKAEIGGNQRVELLHATPQEYGGCKGCNYFYACKGQCPGEGMEGDWRNRSSNCELYKALFEAEERKLVNSGKNILSPATRLKIEKKVLDKSSSRGYNGTHTDTHEDWYSIQVEVR